MSFQKVVVIGGGVLGVQISLMSAYTGHNTVLWLRSEESVSRTAPKVEMYSSMILASLDEAKRLIGNPLGEFTYPKGLIKNWSDITNEEIDKMTEQAKENFSKKLHIELDLKKALEGADIVIESMSENPDAKIEIYQAMKDLMDEETVLCTNSSTMLPSRFAEYTGRADKYLALHFANMIWKNNTAEVMGHAKTDPKAYRRVVEFASAINMIPLELHKEQPGYILNSMLVPFLTAAQSLWAGGVADPMTIDKTWELGTGAPAGPFKILDVVGLETAYNINQMKPEAKDENSLIYKVGKLLKEKIDKGETGINAGKGFYDYTKNE